MYFEPPVLLQRGGGANLKLRAGSERLKKVYARLVKFILICCSFCYVDLSKLTLWILINMSKQNLAITDTCSVCGSSLVEALRHCPTCRNDVGAPNVRYCSATNNIKALNSRYSSARKRATLGGCLTEFESFEDLLKNDSGVVVSMPSGVARNLFESPKNLYTNYESLLGSSARLPANQDDDRHRYGVGGLLFGSYAGSIIYGALSLTEHGLPTYGNVYCKLRSVAIENRTSFLEANSYKFVQEHEVVAGEKLPVGFFACWGDRYKLALTKLIERISSGRVSAEWQDILLHSDGKERDNDEFIEAHIFEGFDWNAIESVHRAPDVKMSRGEELDFDLAQRAFNKLRGL